ncbi:MAG TPA: phosphatase PAP2 family protein [Spirochaetota bacterium]|nr:phosphatase PAP2 family protein [Spirochaetota bacterium]
MDAMYNWGLDLIRTLQLIRTPFLDIVFKAITVLGNDMFYMLMLPVLYWCVDKKQSLRLYLLFMLSSWVNSVTKDYLNHPRPYHLDSGVKVGTTGGPGLPSGHAQGTLVLWGYLSLWARRRWFTIFSIALILLVALSRLYLGVHFPTDILGGWFLGLLLLLPFNAVVDRLEPKVLALSFGWKLALATAVPALLALVVPSRWSVSPMGITAGFALAVMLETKHLNVRMPGSIFQGVARYFIGILVLFVFFFATRRFMPKDSSFYLLMVFAQYYVMGLWVGVAAPWVFRKLGLEAPAEGGGQ